MRKKFFKMHGIGNDYVYFDCLSTPFSVTPVLIKRLSDRHFSIGGDGVILIEKSKVADAKMRIFNSDGSEGKMCGNGIRCVGKYLYDSGKVVRKELTVETLSGVKRLWLSIGANGKVDSVKVDMGRANFQLSALPAYFNGKKTLIGERVFIGKDEVELTCLSVGNPHAVVFSNSFDAFSPVAKQIASAPAFTEGVNVEFATVLSEREVRVRVYERGSGETLACGSGACAVVSAGIRLGYFKPATPVTVSLSGGLLSVEERDSELFMTGKAELAYYGFVNV